MKFYKKTLTLCKNKNERKEKMSNKHLDKTNEEKHLACMFHIGNIYFYSQDILTLIKDRDKEDDWGNIHSKLETAKEALREVFNELWEEKQRKKREKIEKD